MASRRPFTYPRFQAFDSNGAPLSGGTAEFFDAGTTTNRDIYSDAALTTTAPNPVTLNTRGEPESGGGSAIDIYLDNQPYKVVLKDSSGSTVWTIDNYIAIQDITEPEDPADASDQSTDVFEGVLNRDPSSGEIFKVDFQSANTTTAPTFENTGGSLGALTVKTRDGGELWAGALNRVHELLYDGTDLLVLDPDSEQGSSPEHAADGGTDAYASATNTGTPGTGNTIVRDFQDFNTTTTPTLDSVTIKTKSGSGFDGQAVWVGAINGVHALYYDGTDYLVINPNATTSGSGNSVVRRDSGGRIKASDPSVDADVATKGWALAEAASSSDPALAFDTWRTPNANRVTLVIIQVMVETNGSSNGIVLLDVDEGGGTTADYSYEAHSDELNGNGAENYETLTAYIPAGGSYRINNSSDPNSVNAIKVHREFTL